MPEQKLFHFHGGLHLEDHKQESMQQPLHTCDLADELTLRFSQHIGESNIPIVKAGDHIKGGQLLAQTKAEVSAPIHAPTSGFIKAIEQRPIAHASGQLADCFVIEPDGKHDLMPLNKLNEQQKQDKTALLELIRSAGIVGLGGAVFPTAAKLSKASEFDIHTLIINGAECEPYITCDDILMQQHADDVLTGIKYLQTILQVKQTLIGIEDNKKLAIKAMQHALEQSSLDQKTTRIVSIPTLYPSGGEKQLIKILTGREVHSKQLSFEIGIFCQNVGTCAAIAQAIDEQLPLTSRIVTVTGPGVKNSGNWITPLGTPISFLIEQAGGYAVEQPRLIMGGPMMGLRLNTDQVPIVKASNTILVKDETQEPVPQECIRCGRCTDVCPAQLLPQQLYWYSRAKQFDSTEKYNLFDCIECGCCSAVCPSHLPLVQFYRYAKSEIWDQRSRAYQSDRSRLRFEFRESRLLRIKQQDEERRRLKREALARKKAAESKNKNEDSSTDPKAQTVDAVQAALERVKARKKAQLVQPKNTDNLTEAQQRQIEEAEQRRKQSNRDTDKSL